jgi:hypothetical protein
VKGRVITVLFTVIALATELVPIAEAGRWGG